MKTTRFSSGCGGRHPLLLAAYYYLSQPYRLWRQRRAAAENRMPLAIIFYHRVADETPNAWTLSTGLFRQQMLWLKRHCDLVSLEEIQRRMRCGNSRPTASITFDDGYADNCRTALPLLIEHGIPCTYFVTLDNVREGRPFRHDLEAGAPLEPNSLEQLREMAAAGIEIGAHTRTHLDLGQVTDATRLRGEVVGARRQLEEAIGCPIRYFAFPYGLPQNLNREAFRQAREAGYEGVCSAYGGYNLPGDDPFHLRRIHTESMIRLKNWIPLDPRKVRRVKGTSGLPVNPEPFPFPLPSPVPNL